MEKKSFELDPTWILNWHLFHSDVVSVTLRSFRSVEVPDYLFHFRNVSFS